MRFTTTHTQPSAVKRELIPLRQYHVLLLCKMLSHSAHWASVLWRRKAYQRLRLSPMAPIWTFGVLVIHHRWLHTCRRACLTLQRRLDHAGRGTQLRTSSSSKNAFRARLPPKLHRQLLHQHHLQSHWQWGNDPRVANHNGIPSATPPPAPLAIPFTVRERS